MFTENTQAQRQGRSKNAVKDKGNDFDSSLLDYLLRCSTGGAPFSFWPRESTKPRSHFILKFLPTDLSLEMAGWTPVG